MNPIWTPDGKRIAFLVVERSPAEIVWAPVDAIGAAERLAITENYGYPHSFSVITLP
jgi:WD40 repeat protein